MLGANAEEDDDSVVDEAEAKEEDDSAAYEAEADEEAANNDGGLGTSTATATNE